VFAHATTESRSSSPPCAAVQMPSRKYCWLGSQSVKLALQGEFASLPLIASIVGPLMFPVTPRL
jgi:hypothetical protein